MQIDALEILHLRGEQRDAMLVRLESNGVAGWGEATVEPAPLESDQWSGATLAFIQQCLAPQIVGRDISSPEALSELSAQFRGHSLAKGAVDCAWHDLSARMTQRPLWQLLGASGRDVTFTRPLDAQTSIDHFIADLESAVETGLTEATLKLRPGWGIDVVRAVRSAFPTLVLRVDFDGTATIDQRDLLFRLQDYQVTAIEQPLDADDLVGHAMLQESLRIPIALDQSITSAARARMAIDLGACREMRISPHSCGGFTAAKEIIAACRESGINLLAGSHAQTDLGKQHAAAFAMLCGDDVSVELENQSATRSLGAEPKTLSPADLASFEHPFDVDLLRTQAHATIRIT